jgi:putative ABC transport system permease protein
MRQAIDSTKGVEFAIPITKAVTRMRWERGVERVVVLGVPWSFRHLYAGELGIAGQELASLDGAEARFGPGVELSSSVLDLAKLETSKGFRATGAMEALSAVPFSDLNAGAFIVMRAAAAEKMFVTRGRADTVYVRGDPGTSSAALRRRLEVALGGHGIVRTPNSEAKAYTQTFDSLAQLTELGAVGALWVALFAVFNTMSMSLLERRRTVAMLSTLGASRVQLAVSFLGEASIFGALGAAIGIGAGYFIAKILLVSTLDAYPFLPLASTGKPEVTATVVTTALGISLMVAIVGAAVPIRRTLKVTPVEGLSLDPSYEWSRYQGQFRLEGARLVAGMLCCVAVACCVLLDLPSESNGWMVPVLLALLLSGIMLALPPVVIGLLGFLDRLLRRFGPVGPLVTSSLTKNRSRTTITIGVLAVSLSLMISVATALFSFEETMTKVFTDRYGPPLYVTAASYSGVTSDQPLPGLMSKQISKIPGVRTVFPERYLPFNLRDRQMVIVSAPMAREIRDGFSDAVTSTRGISRRSILTGLTSGGIVPSAYTASRHGLKLGSRFSLPGLGETRPLKVVGVYNDVLSIETMYMERKAYVRISGDTSVDRWGVAPSSGVPLGQLRRRLQKFLSSAHIPALVEYRAALVAKILSNVRGVFAIARTVQLAAVIIASLIVAGTMLTVVNERRWEFAINRALGMTRGKIRTMIMLEALVVGIIGSVAALGIGLVTGNLMLDLMESRFLWSIDYSIPWSQLGIAVVVGNVAVLAVSVIPARLAGRVSIVDALTST